MEQRAVFLVLLLIPVLASLAMATRLSALLIRARARRLPSQLGLRMEEEWLAELETMSSRAAKLAFAISLTLSRQRSFAGLAEEVPVSRIAGTPPEKTVRGGIRAFVSDTILMFFLMGAISGASRVTGLSEEAVALFLISLPFFSHLLTVDPDGRREDIHRDWRFGALIRVILAPLALGFVRLFSPAVPDFLLCFLLFSFTRSSSVRQVSFELSIACRIRHLGNVLFRREVLPQILFAVLLTATIELLPGMTGLSEKTLFAGFMALIAFTVVLMSFYMAIIEYRYQASRLAKQTDKSD